MIYLLLFLLSAGLNILVGLHQWPYVLAGNLQDPDSYMRLLRIEQGIRAGHLVTTVAGGQSGAGVMVEWSRLLDMIIWLLAAPLAPFLGWHKALFAAGVALGPLGVGALGTSLAWAVEPFALRRHLWAAAAAAALLPAMASIALPGVVHYHVALLVLIALTAGCVLRALREDTWFGFLAGVFGGFAIWMTPETMPFVLFAFAGLALRWLYAPNANTLLAVAAGCFDVLGFGFFVDPPAGGYGVPEIDRLSYVYVSMGLILLASAALLLRVQARSKRWRGPLGLAVMGVPLLGWIIAFPGVIEGPSGLLPHNQAAAFFSQIIEQQPPRRLELIVFLLPGVWAVLYAGWRVWRESKPEAVNLEGDLFLAAPVRIPLAWAYITFCAAIALALGAGYLLFTSFSALFATALLPVALSRIDAAGGALAMAKRIALLALVLLCPLLAAHGAKPSTMATTGRKHLSCSLHNIGPLLAQAAGKVVLAQPEDTPELLYRSHILTVGSLYHHAIAGFMRDRAAWRSTPSTTEPVAVAATKASYVLFCPKPGRYALVADLPPVTLWDALEKGKKPVWLRAVGHNQDGWTLYKIVP
ncbi:hypothetical protein [Acidocella aminolytica]|uniref:Glycosyltransferase RgtA/B/C/D-like domain-containing protein n=1 Tax=Acidocella aminolytica 101 = DSM 11237 TaxID=1120923 RepID=A0A0D6PEV1_9PROT|nr:hypothetical protein [Acidocella aminolytica]GAN79389.1 hypothetical protein Aam_020_153 [Acidocella aminolytica 101 = DSM 11237]GBQ39329.1 hypothetical protein AA11237_2033 [Acidocella aminolytica 101 = DSM 11237]SHE40023.1 hypothetical protein SAMN02746095_00385 [Acidocella aminolytica 101 = DSM 11237]